MTFDDYQKNFKINDNMVREIVAMGDKFGVPYDQEGYQKSEVIIKAIVKATIARNVWGREAYYPVINEINEIFQEALKLFDEAEALASM